MALAVKTITCIIKALLKLIWLFLPDLFGMSDVTMISTQAVLMDSATIEFSAVLTNSHAQGYDIPISVNGLSNIDFKVINNWSKLGEWMHNCHNPTLCQKL